MVGRVQWDLSQFNSGEAPLLIDRICQQPGQSKPLDQETNRVLGSVFQAWFDEIAADAFAAYLAGPAALFSLSEFLQLGGGYGMSKTHPAHDLRRNAMYRVMQDGGPSSFCAVFQKHANTPLTEDINSPLLGRTPDKVTVYADMVARYGQDSAAVLSELHDSMPSLVDLVYDQVKSYLQTSAPSILYPPNRLDEDLNQHLEAMLAAIPPMERGVLLGEREPCDFATIINVGWVVLLARLSELRVRAETTYDKFERLHELYQ